MTRKISSVSGSPDHPVEKHFEYDNTFVRETLNDGTARLKIGLRDKQATILEALSSELEQPYQLLYVLHTSRTGSPLGRYESPELDHETLIAFLRRFGSFITQDARHDLWIHSESGSTIVIDRYNMIYAYGQFESFERVLANAGVVAVAIWAAPKVPYPHGLHYHEEWDKAEADILSELEWIRKPLRDIDVQFWSGPHAS